MERTPGMVCPADGKPNAAGGGVAGEAVFLAVAFGLAWAVWGIGLWATGLSGAALLSPLGQAVVIPGAFAPAVAAIVVRRWITREGFADAGLRPKLRRGWRHYLAALIVPFAAVSLAGLLAIIAGTAGARTSPSGVSSGFLPTATVLLLFSALTAPFLWGEEFGWRGYLQRRLHPGRPLLAAISVGLIWGVWHYPLAFAGYGTFSEQSALAFLLYPPTCVLLSVFFGWLTEGSGSVWAPNLAHSAHNTAFSWLLVSVPAGVSASASATWVMLLVPYAAVAAWIVLSGKVGGGH